MIFTGKQHAQALSAVKSGLYKFSGLQPVSKTSRSPSFSLADANIDVFQYSMFSSFTENGLPKNVLPPNESVLEILSTTLGKPFNANDILLLGTTTIQGQKK